MSQSDKPHRVLARISSHFIGDFVLDDAILNTFKDLADLSGADRVYLYRIHHKAKLAHITHEWLNKIIPGITGSASSFALSDFSWLISELRSKEMLKIIDLKNLPVPATNEKNALTSQMVKSCIFFPFIANEKLEGLIGMDFISDKIRFSGELIEILKIASDIICFSLERKMSEKTLRKTEKLYQGIFENTGAATITIRPDSEITMVNSEFEKITGYSRKAVVGKMRLIDLVNENDQSFIRRYHHLLMSNPGGVPEHYEFRYWTKKKEERIAYMTGSSLLDTKNCVISFIDITDFKETENQLIIAKEKAEESDRLKSAFLANVSHEIRTPLNAITGFSSLLANPNLHLDKKEKYIKQILNGSSELVNLIDNVLDISRIESETLKPKITEFNLNDKLKETLDFYNEFKLHHAKENLDVRLKLPKEPKKLMVKTDKMRLQQILSNILENAIKFTTTGTIEFGYSILKNGGNSTKQNILFFIKDSGIGIDKKNFEKIFERFIKIVDMDQFLYRGAGLGLALARDLVHLLHGEIWVESSIGKGSTFYFTIPYVSPAIEKTTKKYRSECAKGDWTGKTILIAEDTESNYLYIDEVLSPTHARLIRARDGLESVELFNANKNEIDLVFMDILMPEYDGYEATEKIRQIKKNIPVIAQTAFTFEGELVDGLYAGCFNDYILKPFNIKAIQDMLEKYLFKDST